MEEVVVTVVGFAVVVVVLWRYALPAVRRLVEERQDAIQREVEEAQAATRDLHAAQARLDSSVEQAREEGARIRDDARADATGIREELVAQAKQEVARMRQRGQEQLAAERDQVVRGLRGHVGAASMQLTERVVHEALADERARSASVDGFLSDLENLPLRGAVPAGGGAS